MSDIAEHEVERPGIDRRTLIKRTAVAGAVAWAAPTIIGSLASPAGAVTGGFPCSYAMLAVQLADNSIVAVKVNVGATACTNTNATSNDNTFTTVCGANTFTNSCSGDLLCRNGAVVPANSGACPVTVSGGTITATAGNTILFAIAHDGSCGATHFCTGQCSGPFTAPANCTGA